MNKVSVGTKRETKIKIESFLNKKLMVVLFRWIIILIVSILIYYQRREFKPTDPAVIILLFITLSNGILTFIKQRFFEQPKYIFIILLADIISISILFRFISSENYLYLIFFAVLFISSISQNVKWSLFVAMIASLFYLTILTMGKKVNLSAMLMNPEIAIKIPFIFLIAIWTSFWSELYKKKKDEEDKIKEFNKELEEGIKIATAKERKVTQDLKQMKEYNENILKSLNSGIIVIDMKGFITTVNPEAVKILGLKSNGTVGLSFLEVKKFQPFQDILITILGDGKKSGIHEVSLNNGKTLNMTFSILKESDKEKGATVVFQDITDLKKMKEKIKQSESLAHLGKTVAWIAHEIRNLLSNIIGYAQLIEMKFDNVEGLNMFSTPLIKSTEKVSVLMTDILDFSKERKLKKEAVNINSLIEELKNDFTKSSNEIKLYINKDKNLDTIISNHEALCCIFSNLIRNAKEAIEENSNKGKIQLDFEKQDHKAIFGVEDTGKGIKKNDLKLIFNPFHTTKKDGTGLGLSIVKKIVESLDGSISVRSKIRKGTRFTISFPIEN